MLKNDINQMEAIIKFEKGFGKISHSHVPVPEIGDNEVLIEIKASAICGTDVHIYHDDFPYWPPVILGHEFSGVIAGIGKNVLGWGIGDRVVGEPHTLACGLCYYCRTGNIQNCVKKRSPGWGIDGSFAEYMRYPEPKLLHKLPDSISFEEGSLIEPFANVITDVIERGNLRSGDQVVVIGPGPIGLMAGLAARATGAAQVTLIGTNADELIRMPLAKKLGCFDHVINAQTENVQKVIEKTTGGLGADIVVEASGAAAGISTAISVARKYATIVGIGLPSQSMIEFPYKESMQKVLSYVCNMSTSYTSWNRSIAMIENGLIDLKPLISEIVPLGKWEESLKKIEAKKVIKVVISSQAHLCSDVPGVEKYNLCKEKEKML